MIIVLDTLNIITEPLSPPHDAQLINISSEGITFDWTAVSSDHSAIVYRIFSTNCGVCPEQTNLTTIVCSDVHLSGESQMCTLNVQVVVCGDIVGSKSDPLNISLQGF